MTKNVERGEKERKLRERMRRRRSELLEGNQSWSRESLEHVRSVESQRGSSAVTKLDPNGCFPCSTFKPSDYVITRGVLCFHSRDIKAPVLFLVPSFEGLLSNFFFNIQRIPPKINIRFSITLFNFSIFLREIESLGRMNIRHLIVRFCRIAYNFWHLNIQVVGAKQMKFKLLHRSKNFKRWHQVSIYIF